MRYHINMRCVRFSDWRNLHRLSMEMTEADSIGSLMGILEERCPQVVPFDGLFHIKLRSAGGLLPEHPSDNNVVCQHPFHSRDETLPDSPTNHNTSYGESIWKDYTEFGFYKEDPVAAIYDTPALRNTPVRANCNPDFYETALYNDLLKKYDIHMQMAMRMDNLTGSNVLGLVQMKGSRAYTSKDELLLGLLAPFISASIERCELLEIANTDNSNGASARFAGRILGLSRREAEIIEMVSFGISNKEIGERLYLSELTVKTHMTRILRKTGARNRVELMAEMIKQARSPIGVQERGE